MNQNKTSYTKPLKCTWVMFTIYPHLSFLLVTTSKFMLIKEQQFPFGNYRIWPQ